MTYKYFLHKQANSLLIRGGISRTDQHTFFFMSAYDGGHDSRWPNTMRACPGRTSDEQGSGGSRPNTDIFNICVVLNVADFKSRNTKFHSPLNTDLHNGNTQLTINLLVQPVLTCTCMILAFSVIRPMHSLCGIHCGIVKKCIDKWDMVTV